MPKRKRMRASRLPNSTAAWWFACQCFGVGLEDLNAAIHGFRKTDVDPQENLPWQIFSQHIKRAKRGQGRWAGLIQPLCHRALATRVQWLNRKPLDSFTAQFTYRLVSLLLRVYERLLPGLRGRGIRNVRLLWVVVEHALVPTAFNLLVKEWRNGLGREFEGERCWYLPKKAGGGRVYPIRRLLDSWLRVSGYLTIYGISSQMEEKWRRTIERWWKGERGKPAPTVENLYKVVDRFAADVRWLERPEEWKGRFMLASAMQRLCTAMDGYFKPVRGASSRLLALRLRSVLRERIVVNDDDEILNGEHTFFAGRLLQLKLRRQGKWNSVVLARLPSGGRSFGPDEEQEESEYRRRIDWEMKAGNWVMEWIKKEIRREQRAGNLPASGASLEELVFELGVLELNRLLSEGRAGGRTRRR